MLQSFSESPLSLIPALLTIALAIYTHRVLLSIGIGSLVGSLLLHNFAPLPSLLYLKDTFIQHFFSGGEWMSSNLYIISFLFLMGIMIHMMALVGATEAFAHWAGQHAKSRRSAKYLIAFMALIFFIDDYFHSLAAGNISRPIADRYKISRAKLAYLLDSTAAPLCVITPISSWGAYIISLLSGILLTLGIQDTSALSLFASIIPMTYYTLFTFLIISIVCIFDINLAGMYREELKAAQSTPEPEQEDLDPGSLWLLVTPIALTSLGSIAMILYTGSQALTSFSVIQALENARMELSLVVGALIGLLVLAIDIMRRPNLIGRVASEAWQGCLSMWPAVSILIFAWTIAAVTRDMGTGQYLASLSQAHIPAYLLPCLVFALSAFIAFSTGTSWGTFGIMLPLAAHAAGGSEQFLPLLSAVLSGSVLGDHCSPISDTTILSSSGAGCHHMTHVMTQLPYALIAAALSAISYLVLGYTQSATLGFGAGFCAFVVVAGVLISSRKRIQYIKN